MDDSEKLRLLLVTKDFPPDVGGIQTWARELGRRFVARCDDFMVVAPKLPGSAEVDRELPFPVWRVRCTRPTFAGQVVLELPGFLKRRPFDTLLGAQWQTAMPGVIHRHRGPLKRVFTAVMGRELLTRHFSALPFGAQAYSRARKATLERVDGMFPISQYTQGLVEEIGVSTERSKVVLIGCDTERFLPVDAESLKRELGLHGHKVLLSVCRLVPRKGIDTVLEALPEIRRRVPNALYVVGGDGPDRARLEARAKELGVSENVRFLGHFPQARLTELYCACDVFVLAAREVRPDVEGFGLVLLEANACGKPAVATRSGGVADALADGETGLIVEPGSSLRLAEAVASILTDEQLAARFRARARPRVLEQATWDRVTSDLLAGMDGFSRGK